MSETPALGTTILAWCGIGALILWRLYARFRRLVGRQRLSPRRAWVTAIVFPSLAVLLLLSSHANPNGAPAILGGASAGIVLGVLGLRLTKFERSATGLFYTPNAHIGIGLSLLLMGRVGYRVGQAVLSAAPVDAPPTDFSRSAITMLIFGALAAYYATYAIGLLRWRHKVSAVRMIPDDL